MENAGTEDVRLRRNLVIRRPLAEDGNLTLCRPSAYALARRLIASWIEDRVMKVARVLARFSKSLARRVAESLQSDKVAQNVCI